VMEEYLQEYGIRWVVSRRRLHCCYREGCLLLLTSPTKPERVGLKIVL
jgi:hypothetical protein